MSRKKRPNQTPQKTPQGPLPVVHGDAFRAFIAEATSIGNECEARRLFDADVVEYLTQKGLMEEWSAWRAAKRATPAR